MALGANAEECGELPLTPPERSQAEKAPVALSGADVGAAWPSVQPRVAALLGARGVQGADVDDILQEVALRALRQQRSFESDDHFVRWCCRVAINLHIDSTRRQRRLAASLLEDGPSTEDTARTAERRMDLAVLATGISELSPDEQQLLLDPVPAASRAEAVRLAVRRHRVRARLAALLEGVVVGVPLLRKVLRSMSTPTKASLAALPVVVTVGLLALPPLYGPSDHDSPERASASPGHPAPVDRRAHLIGTIVPPTVARETPGAPKPDSARTHAAPRTGARTIVVVNPAGQPVGIEKETHPDPPTFCLGGVVSLCVDRPGPKLPKPVVVPLP